METEKNRIEDLAIFLDEQTQAVMEYSDALARSSLRESQPMIKYWWSS